MTYDLDTPAKGPVILSQPTDGETIATPLPTIAPAVAFALGEPSQRFLAGRHWLAEGDTVFVQEVGHLVTHGWTANDRNEHGDALMHVAVRSARWASVAWLMANGADPMLTNNHGHTPVWLARRRPVRHLPPAFRALVEAAKEQGLMEDPAPAPASKPSRANRAERADTKARTTAPQEPRAPRAPKAAAAPAVAPTRAEPRAERPARPAVTVSVEAQRFTQAMDTDDRALMMQLLVEGFDLGSHNEQGNTVLHEALARNAWEWTDRLINYGAPLLARDRQGKSVLDHVEQRWTAQDEHVDLDRYEMFQDAIADEKAAQRVALGQGLTRSTKSLFKDKTEVAIDWKGLPEDPDRPERPAPAASKANRPKNGKGPRPGAGQGQGQNAGGANRYPARARKTGAGNGPKGPRKGNGQPNPLVTSLGSGAHRRSSLDRPLREVNEYGVPKGATLAPDVVIVRKVRRTLVKP